jgi:hypothetical protein
MSDLLELAIAAHGGWERWQQLKTLNAHVAIGGGIWPLKGWPDVFADARVSIDPHRQHIEYSSFVEAGRHSLFETGRTAVVTDGGELIEQREAPRAAFEGHSVSTPWDAHHLIYFAGYAMWSYLTTPFLFKLPGFQAEEVEPWSEDGETWRRLKVTFPTEIESHSTAQTFYFNADGILQRHDYSVEVMGGTASANYATDPKKFGGFIFPTKRRIYSIGPDNKPVRERVSVAIDFHTIEPT